MKKFLWRTAAILVLLLVAFWAYIRYQEYRSYQTLIPQTTRTLIRADVYALYKSMLRDMIGGKSPGREQSFKGIDIPANIFIYNLRYKEPTTLFTSLPVKGRNALHESLKASGLAPLQDKDGITVMANAGRTLIAAYTADRVVFCYTPSGEDVLPVLIGILKELNMVAVARSGFQKIREEEGHITIYAPGLQGGIQFERGSARMHLRYTSGKPGTPAKVNHRRPDSSDVISGWCYADMRPWLSGKTFTIDSFRISGDSLLSFHPKGIAWLVGSPVIQQDTVVTYEYNDDFEKVATVSMQETRVPGISIQVFTGTTGLSRYLQQQHILDADSLTVNRKVFPLCQLYAQESNDYLWLGAGNNNAPAAATETSADFLGLYINFRKLGEQQEFALLRSYIRPLERLHVTAHKEANESILLEGSLRCKDPDRNALLQLLEIFRP